MMGSCPGNPMSADSAFAVVVGSPAEAAAAFVEELASIARAAVKAERVVVVGLATGRTPRPIYAEWVRRFEAGESALAAIDAFAIDEYLGVPPDHLGTCRSYLEEHLLGPLGVPAAQRHVPDAGDCAGYERAIREAGGLDVLLVGIGRNGHLGFNEPGSAIDSRTRRVCLEASTREDAAPAFGGLEQTPAEGVTIGVATMLEARRIRAFAFGEHKRAIVAKLRSDAIGAALPATFLRLHGDIQLHLDGEAAGEEAT
jgi:glucosamine-6-phosphate deaminase